MALGSETNQAATENGQLRARGRRSVSCSFVDLLTSAKDNFENWVAPCRRSQHYSYTHSKHDHARMYRYQASNRSSPISTSRMHQKIVWSDSKTIPLDSSEAQNRHIAATTSTGSSSTSSSPTSRSAVILSSVASGNNELPMGWRLGTGASAGALVILRATSVSKSCIVEANQHVSLF